MKEEKCNCQNGIISWVHMPKAIKSGDTTVYLGPGEVSVSFCNCSKGIASSRALKDYIYNLSDDPSSDFPFFKASKDVYDGD